MLFLNGTVDPTNESGPWVCLFCCCHFRVILWLTQFLQDPTRDHNEEESWSWWPNASCMVRNTANSQNPWTQWLRSVVPKRIRIGNPQKQVCHVSIPNLSSVYGFSVRVWWLLFQGAVCALSTSSFCGFGRFWVCLPSMLFWIMTSPSCLTLVSTWWCVNCWDSQNFPKFPAFWSLSVPEFLGYLRDLGRWMIQLFFRLLICRTYLPEKGRFHWHHLDGGNVSIFTARSGTIWLILGNISYSLRGSNPSDCSIKLQV